MTLKGVCSALRRPLSPDGHETRVPGPPAAHRRSQRLRVSNDCHRPACPGGPETWRPIPGHEDAYEVSDHGRVRSLPGGRRRPGILSTAGPRPNVRLNGRANAPRTIQTLVLEAFVGPCPPGMECCHHDDNSRNNHLANLRWDTPTGNLLDRVRNGRHHNTNKTHCPLGHLLSLPNLHRSHLLNGLRACLACHRGRAFIRSRKITDPDESRLIIDRYYEQIMKGER